MTIDEAIKHCEEVAKEQENFENFKCEYCKLGCEDGVWKDTCRYPSNIPKGCSWGKCSESNCPLFSKCLECANEHRQLAERLRKLKAYEEELPKEIKNAKVRQADALEANAKNENYNSHLAEYIKGYLCGLSYTEGIIAKVLEEINDAPTIIEADRGE